MRLPFTLDQFLDVFREYSEGIGPAPVLLMVLAILVIVLAHTRDAWRHRAIALLLALLWLWAGVVYHWGFFERLNPAASLFGALFVLQAALFLFSGAVRNRLTVEPGRGRAGVAGWVLVVYALVAYPLLGMAMGHGYPAGPSFGAPCPVVILTLGVMLWSVPRVPLHLVIVPLAWAAVGTSAALQLGIREDLGLTVAAIVVVAEVVRQRRSGVSLPARSLPATR